jgi:hypothetical protein
VAAAVAETSMVERSGARDDLETLPTTVPKTPSVPLLDTSGLRRVSLILLTRC